MCTIQYTGWTLGNETQRITLKKKLVLNVETGPFLIEGSDLLIKDFNPLQPKPKNLKYEEGLGNTPSERFFSCLHNHFFFERYILSNTQADNKKCISYCYVTILFKL